MSGFINPQSLSFEQILQELIRHVESKPDAARWKDFNESAAGATIAEWMAGFGAYLAFHANTASREVGRSSALRRSSLVNMAETLGYPYNRASAPKLRITFTPSTTEPWDKSDPIGQYGNRPLSLLQSAMLTEGRRTTLEAVVGSWKTATRQGFSGKPFQRVFIEDPTIDNDISRLRLWVSPYEYLTGDSYRVQLVRFAEDLEKPEGSYRYKASFATTQPGVLSYNFTLLPGAEAGTLRIQAHLAPRGDRPTLETVYDENTNPNDVSVVLEGQGFVTYVDRAAGTVRVEFHEDPGNPPGNGTQNLKVVYAAERPLVPDRVSVATHHDGIHLVFGDGKLGRLLQEVDRLTFEYVSTEGRIPRFDSSQVRMTPLGIVHDVALANPGYAADSDDKLRAVASGYFAARRKMITPEDHAYAMLSYGDVVSANCIKDESECCTALIAYLMADERIIVEDSEEHRAVLSYLSQFQVVSEKIELVAPEAYDLDFRVTVVGDHTLTEDGLAQSIREAVEPLIRRLGETFHVGDAIAALHDLDGVSRVYVEHPLSDKELEFNQYLRFKRLVLRLSTDPRTVVLANPDYLTAYTGYLSEGEDPASLDPAPDPGDPDYGYRAYDMTGDTPAAL